MAKNILILAGSPRKNGNSAMLCKEFAKGAEEAGNTVELIYLREVNCKLKCDSVG